MQMALMAMNARAFLLCVEGGRRPPDERVPQVSERGGNGLLSSAAARWGHGVSEEGKSALPDGWDRDVSERLRAR